MPLTRDWTNNGTNKNKASFYRHSKDDSHTHHGRALSRVRSERSPNDGGGYVSGSEFGDWNVRTRTRNKKGEKENKKYKAHVAGYRPELDILKKRFLMCSSKYKKERKKNCCSTNSQRYCRQGGVIVTDQGLEPFDDRRTIQLKRQVKVTRQKREV